jgi:hypothetical protein
MMFTRDIRHTRACLVGAHRQCFNYMPTHPTL